jgi:signal transduction histidine kinase
MDGEKQHLIKQMDFTFSDGDEGSIFIISDVDDLVPEVKSMLKEMLLMAIIILAIVGVALTLWIYSAILSPLGKLQEATKKIMEGDLDFTLDVDADYEIGQLCQDFEEMRIRLKENAEEKIQYDKESKELISNISHDLKTPITAIKGYVEGIMDGVASSPEKLDKYIRTIYNKANDMDRLIDELTFYSKIDTNKIPYAFSKINVAQYFKDCVEEVGLDMDSRGIELGYFNYVDEDVMVIADAEQMKRVINNIIGNSVKYLDKKRGIINIRIKDVGDFIQVEIEDNGKGIATKDLPYIFERFYRTDSSRNSSKGGSGIGLSIVRKIIEDHGGRIWATSKEGIGTEIHFVLRKYQEVIQNEQDTDRRG